ncbi:Calcium-activated potassium channel subunit beta-4 [Myotis davidii]|uniref:Calcium-activated potassium channel subunit beta n=1 Tax=Myotis davidii TaxID=225400 RepID=L5LKT9_MYODS|nr:Calcium-activated potassium channel subunit beta-4 [Myotis davidii]
MSRLALAFLKRKIITTCSRKEIQTEELSQGFLPDAQPRFQPPVSRERPLLTLPAADHPALQDLQATAANCTVLSVQQIGEVFECTFTCGADCRGTAQYPCVQVYVNNSESNSRALLHSDEHQLLTNPKCSYIPPCKRENQKNLESVMNWQQYWKDEIGSQPFTCYFNQFQRPDDVLLHRTHDEIVLLHCFLWPLVTFVVGVLIVVLTICAKSLAVKAEAMKKRKFS